MFLVAFGTGIANAIWLPWLIEDFKVEDVETPVKCSTDTFMKKSLGVVGARDRRSVVGTACRR